MSRYQVKHRALMSEDQFGVHLSCSAPDCEFAEGGFGHVELARPVALLHELEGRVEGFEKDLREWLTLAVEVSTKFPASGGHYAAGYTAALREALAMWEKSK